MQVDLPYGKLKLTIEVPDRATVLTSRHFPGVADEEAAIRAALRDPIGCAPLLLGYFKLGVR